MRFRNSLPVALFSLSLACASILPASRLQAGASNKSGNPYGNGTQFPDGGSYSALLRGPSNLVGSVIFTTASSTTAPGAQGASNTINATNSGLATVYANGIQFTGTAIGATDPNNGQLNCSYSLAGVGQIYQLQTVDSTPITDSNGDTIGFTYSYGLTNFTASNNCAGEFQAQLQNNYPLQTFSGTGEVTVNYSSVTSSNVTNHTGTITNVAVAYYPSNSTTVYTNQVVGSSLSAP